MDRGYQLGVGIRDERVFKHLRIDRFSVRGFDSNDFDAQSLAHQDLAFAEEAVDADDGFVAAFQKT